MVGGYTNQTSHPSCSLLCSLDIVTVTIKVNGERQTQLHVNLISATLKYPQHDVSLLFRLGFHGNDSMLLYTKLNNGAVMD